MANAGLTSDAAYQAFKQVVDVQNLADYVHREYVRRQLGLAA